MVMGVKPCGNICSELYFQKVGKLESVDSHQTHILEENTLNRWETLLGPCKQIFVTTITFLTAGKRDSFNAKMRRKLFGTDRAVQHDKVSLA
jgi:hypothetical protein